MKPLLLELSKLVFTAIWVLCFTHKQWAGSLFPQHLSVFNCGETQSSFCLIFLACDASAVPCGPLFDRALWAITHMTRIPVLWISFYIWSEISCLREDNFKRAAMLCWRVSSMCMCCTAGVRTCSTTTVLKSHWQYVSLHKASEGYFWLFVLNALIARCLSRMWHFCTEAHPPQRLNYQNRPIMENSKLWLFSLPLASPQVWYFWILVLHLYKFFISVSKFVRKMEKISVTFTYALYRDPHYFLLWQMWLKQFNYHLSAYGLN